MVNVKSLWESQKPTGEIIIRTRIDDIPHLRCYAATNHITGQHLYIMSLSPTIEIPELKNYRFRGVEIFTVESEEIFELNIYLLDNDLKDIFALFIQNILDDVSESVTESEGLKVTLNVLSKWKRLFDKINFNGLSLQQQKGLIGELLFMNFILDNQKSIHTAIHGWTGVDFEDKDFVFGASGVEVKMTSSKNPRIKISSERQLDTQNLSDLCLVLYSTEEVRQNGFSLNSLVEQTRQKISANSDELKFFDERLLLAGYLSDDREHYNRMYSLKRAFFFDVDEHFPKIVRSHIPLGIYDTSYFIELSAAEPFMVDAELILSRI